MTKTKKSLIFFFIILLVMMIYFRPAQLGGGNYYLVVVSGSMEPTLNVGDWVVCVKTPYDTIQVNDIVVVKHSNIKIPILHRVVEKTDTYLLTKGDCNDVPDNFITIPENLLARYEGLKIPKLGLFIAFSTKTPIGLVLFYYVPCAVVALILIQKYWSQKRKESEQQNSDTKVQYTNL